MSCDAYSDLWEPFFKLLERHWADQPFPVYLGAGEKSCTESYVTMLRSKAGRDWAQCMIDYLEQIPQRYVLLILDDFFLRKTVDTAKVMKCLAFAQQQHAIHVRLAPRPRPTRKIDGNSLIGECEAGSPYRLCAQAAIWDKQRLLSLVRPGESIWDFEHNGNKRAEMLQTGFYSVWKPALPYEGAFAHHVIEKGKWFPHEKWVFGRQDIGCDFTRRGILPWHQVLFYQGAQLIEILLDVFPWRQKKRLKSGLKYILQPLFSKQFKRMHAG